METVTCEHCGKVTPKKTAERLVVEGWTHSFCSERCKIQWGEQGPAASVISMARCRWSLRGSKSDTPLGNE